MRKLDLLVGSAWGQRVVVLGTVALYAYLVAFRPHDAAVSAEHGLQTTVHLATTVVAALFLSSAIGRLLPEDRLSEMLGSSANTREVVAAGFVTGLVPGGPYAVYPVVRRMQEAGAGTAAVLTMITGYSLIGIGRVPYGLVFFAPGIVGARLLVAGVATVLAGSGFVAASAALRRD